MHFLKFCYVFDWFRYDYFKDCDLLKDSTIFDRRVSRQLNSQVLVFDIAWEQMKGMHNSAVYIDFDYKY